MENKMNYKEQTELAGYYDTCASYFGGDPVMEVENKYFKNNKVGFMNWLKKTSKKIEEPSWFKIKGKTITHSY